MNRLLSLAIGAALVVGLAPGSGGASSAAAAHHSFAMYDQTVERTMTGQLVRYIIGANHSQFIFDLVDENGDVMVGDDGKPVQWGVETGPAVSIARQGITTERFKIGTIFSVTLNPLRDGNNFGAQRGPLIMCGMTMPAGGCTAETGESFGN
jgi:hypothetical protein